MTGRLRLESLEDRWNLSPLEPLALVTPSEPSNGAALPTVSSYALVIDTRETRQAGGGQQDYFKITMEDILVSSYSVGDLGLTAPPSGPEPSKFDYLVNVEGIKGETEAIGARLPDDIWVDGRVITGENPASARVAHGSGGGGGAGKVQMQDIHFGATVSKATPKLFLFCADGEHVEPGSPDGYTENPEAAGTLIPVKVKHNV